MYNLVRMIPFWNDRHLVNSACLNYERVSGKKNYSEISNFPYIYFI